MSPAAVGAAFVLGGVIVTALGTIAVRAMVNYRKSPEMIRETSASYASLTKDMAADYARVRQERDEAHAENISLRVRLSKAIAFIYRMGFTPPADIEDPFPYPKSKADLEKVEVIEVVEAPMEEPG